MPQSHAHHYVPQWYQKRFLNPGQSKYHYLDLRPEIVVREGVLHKRRALLHWGPKRCFYGDHLYTLTLGGLTSDQVERRFFGPIDANGQKAVELFGPYRAYCDGVHDAFMWLMHYMDAQRLRTPRGLDWLRAMTRARTQSQTLVALQAIFQRHITMWTEAVWEIASARQSPTKFIVSDNPVTFFNSRAFPGSATCRHPGDVPLECLGTRTLFPLGRDACLILTHLQLVRNPWANAMRPRINARAYQQTMKALLDIQFGRELTEDEVRRVNFVLKKRASRYIAAAEEDWLYPERHIASEHWSKLDEDWFLLPHLWKVPFSGGIMVGYKGGGSWAMDEHGRKRNHPAYRERKLHDEEWVTHQKAQKAWAVKREGCAVAHTDKFNHDVGDDLMMDYLTEWRSEGRKDV